MRPEPPAASSLPRRLRAPLRDELADDALAPLALVSRDQPHPLKSQVDGLALEFLSCRSAGSLFVFGMADIV